MTEKSHSKMEHGPRFREPCYEGAIDNGTLLPEKRIQKLYIDIGATFILKAQEANEYKATC